MTPPPLHILQVNTVFNGGGADNQCLELSKGLHARGHDVTLAIRAGCQWESLALGLDLPVFRLPSRRAGKVLRLLRLAQYARSGRFEMIHAHQGRDFWPAIVAGRLAGRKTRVVITRNLMTRPSGLSRQGLLHFAHVVAVSHAVERVLERELHGPRRRLHQIHCGINTDAFVATRNAAGEDFRRQHRWGERDVVFGILGRYGMPRGKGHLEFLEAAARLKEAFPEARFAIVGSGSMGPLLRERIQSLGLGESVTMVPFTNEMPTVLNALDVVVHPAVGTDAFPLVVLEGMASGKPIIASNLDGIPEQFEPVVHGLLVPPGEVPALAEAMRALLHDPERRAQMGAAGREHVCAHFTHARQTERYERLYRQVLAG